MLIDMFSGAGGLTEGFLRGKQKFIAHIEMDSYAISTLETRLFYYILKNNNQLTDYYDYLKGNISKEELYTENIDLLKDVKSTIINKEINQQTEKPILKQIKQTQKKFDIKSIDGIIGGPPCQAYSLVGRAIFPDSMKNDSRNYLFRYYINFIKQFKPNFFVFENVPGMLSAQNCNIYNQFIEELEKIEPQYKVDKHILCAEDFNVLQSRKRLIVIGHRNKDNFFEEMKKPKGNQFKLSSIFKDLPSLQPNEGTNSAQKYLKSRNTYLKRYHIRTNKDVLLNHKARFTNEKDRTIYRIAIKDWNLEKRRIKYNELPKDLKTHKNQESFIDRFKVVAKDLHTSHTIMAHLSKDGHYYIHPDIEQAISITVRESARIQSFPDSFKFEGPKTSQFKQIGNAVPPLMAESLAKNIYLNF